MNVAPYIEETIQSVLSQSYKDWEMIIMDGASKDGTGDVVKKYTDKHPNIRFYSESDEGSWHAFDKTFDLAQGEFICNLCGQDGFLDKDWLKACVDTFDKDPQVALVWGLARTMNTQGRILDEHHVSYSQFMKTEGPLTGAKNLFGKFFHVAKGLLFEGSQRRKFLWEKLFSPASRLRLNLLTDRSFAGGAAPQKQAWFDYWLKTALVFPDQSMMISKKVWLDCIPRYQKGHKTVGFLMDFYFNFNVKGYLAYYLPIYAMFGRQHGGQSGERAGEELHRSFMSYLDRVHKFQKTLTSEHQTITFHDREGRVLGEKKF
jgi:glycosyltransferase involved in cell wall biosynthesis